MARSINGRKRPLNLATALYDRNVTDPKVLSSKIRQLHDFYGWKAKGTAHQRGLCSGALYRTENYLAIPQEQRNGSKSVAKNVHIEHTIPVKVLVTLIQRLREDNTDLYSFFDKLMEYSVCTAMTEDEAKLLSKTGVPAASSPCFNNLGELLNANPFSRYMPMAEKTGLKIFNVVTGKEIDIYNFTFREHLETLFEISKMAGAATSIYRIPT